MTLKRQQLSTTKSKKEKTKQTSRTGTELQVWRSFGGLSAGKGKGENGGKGAGIRKHNGQVQNRQENVKNSIGNGKELICMTHGHKLREEDWWREGRYWMELGKGEKLGQL